MKKTLITYTFSTWCTYVCMYVCMYEQSEYCIRRVSGGCSYEMLPLVPPSQLALFTLLRAEQCHLVVKSKKTKELVLNAQPLKTGSPSFGNSAFPIWTRHGAHITPRQANHSQLRRLHTYKSSITCCAAHNKVYGYEAVLMAAFALGMNAKLYRTHRMWGRACESQTEYMCALPLFLSLLRWREIGLRRICRRH